jgi:hypothetical protein
MVKWQVTIVQGGEVLLQLERELPYNVLPPTYVNDINCASFLPLAGEFERTVVLEDAYENKVFYEKINPYFGGF